MDPTHFEKGLGLRRWGVSREQDFEGRPAISEVKFGHIHVPWLTTVTTVYNMLDLLVFFLFLMEKLFAFS